MTTKEQREARKLKNRFKALRDLNACLQKSINGYWRES